MCVCDRGKARGGEHRDGSREDRRARYRRGGQTGDVDRMTLDDRCAMRTREIHGCMQQG